MEAPDSVFMFVRWGQQLRQTKIKINDDINTIEKAISDTYQLQRANNLDTYQIQFYDGNSDNFMDLYPDTFNIFQQILNKLLSPEAPPQSAKEWYLRIIPKAVPTIQSIVHQSNTDDTYYYHLENEPTESPSHELTLTIPNNIQPIVIPRGPRINIHRHLPRDPTLENNHEDQQETARPAVLPETTIISDHPCDLGFDEFLAPQQRLQYEKEMFRTISSKSTRGGVFLQVCQKSDTKSYPTVHFKIPEKKLSFPWFLYLWILTVADVNGIHYLHASKGIHNDDTEREDQVGGISNSGSFNPYVVRLSPEQIRDGKYEIYIKVCNMKDLPGRKNEKLREFPRLDNPKAYDDPTLLSSNTTNSLNLSSEKYHLGCTLLCNKRKYDQCISSLTTAEPYNKRPNNNQTTTRRVKRSKETQKEQ